MASYIQFSLPEGIYRDVIDKAEEYGVSASTYAKHLMLMHMDTTPGDEVMAFKREYERRAQSIKKQVIKPIGGA